MTETVLAAAVLSSDHLRTLVSADQAFAVVRGLDWADPARAADRERLGIGHG